MTKPTLLLADDHQIVLEGLRSLLAHDFDLVGVVTDGTALVAEAERCRPDVIVADVSMPSLNGLDAVRQIRAAGIDAKVVFLTMHADVTYVTRALETGASGYVLKHAASDELVTAIRDALRGVTYISPSLRGPALEDHLNPYRRSQKQVLEPTPRQREVLQLLAEGKSAKEIAAALGISSRTVETHKYKMMDDLGLKTSAQLVQYAVKHGLASP